MILGSCSTWTTISPLAPACIAHRWCIRNWERSRETVVCASRSALSTRVQEVDAAIAGMADIAQWARERKAKSRGFGSLGERLMACTHSGESHTLP